MIFNINNSVYFCNNGNNKISKPKKFILRLTKFTLALSIILTFFLSEILTAQVWTISDGPYKGQINDFDISFTNPNLVYIASTTGIYKTTNAGVNWRKMSGTNVDRISLSQLNNSFVITNKERSFDDGETWQLITAVNSKQMKHSPGINTVVYSISASNRIERTTDFGNNWNVIDDSAGIYGEYKQIFTDKNNDQIIYSLSENGWLNKSTNRGNTWQRIKFAAIPAFYMAGTVDPNNSQRLILAASDSVYVSVNGGITYSVYKNNSTSRPKSIKIDWQNGNNVYMISWFTFEPKSFFRSTNGGQTFISTFGNALSMADIKTVSDGKIYLGSAFAGMMRSNNGGLFFKSVGYEFIASQGIKAVTENIVYTWDGVAYYKTVDGGMNWTIIQGTGGFYPDALAISPTDPNKIYIANFSSLSMSSNGGTDFTNTLIGSIDAVQEIYLRSDNADLIYIKGFSGTSVQLIRTTNGGSSWGLITLPNATNFWNLRLSNSEPGVMYYFPDTFNNLLLYRTTNSGLNWTLLNLPLQGNEIIYDAQVDGTGRLFAGALSFYESTNRGDSWTRNYNYLFPNPQVFDFFIQPGVTSKIYSINPNNNRLFGTTNTGVNWYAVNNSGLPGDYQFLYEAGISSNGKVFVSTEKGFYSGIPTLVNMEGNTTEITERYELFQNKPNPFNPETEIKFNLPEATGITLKIYNIKGQEVLNVAENEFKNSGIHKVYINMGNFPSGIYFYLLKTNKFVKAKKMVLVK